MFVADYVLMEYGTGAIMAVPAHDSRDYEFAKAFDLPVRRVIEGDDAEVARDDEGLPYPGDGPMTGSGRFDGKDNREAYDGDRRLARARRAAAEAAVNYRLRDWLVSRQRYWGAPIPVVYCEKCGIVPVPDDQLPVELPEIDDYAPQGRSPLAAAEDWVATECPRCGGAGAARDRHDGHLRRLLLVLHPLPRPAQRRRPPGTAPRPTTGSPSTSTSAASSTRSCT